MGVYLLVLCFVFAYLSSVVELLDNGLARRPPMGWMSWGYYMCGVDCRKNPLKCLDEKLILSVADTFYKEGYLEAGFEYIIIDDCWSEKKRDEYGRLVPDSERFPRGMKYIADYIHKLGLKFGMYTNIAKTTCMGYPGSRDYFKRDAKMFAEWDVDYLKVDGCFVEEDYLNTAYIKLGAHLNTTGRPMVYSCSWPYYIEFIHHKQPDYESVSKYCNVWRSYHDVVTSWRAIKTIITHYQNEYEHLYKFHGPGHWNDPDMLIFGTGSLTDSQSRVHIAVYSMLAGPLLLSCDMTRISEYEKKLLLNLNLIAIAQDPLGVMAKPYVLQKQVTLWVKPHLPRKGDKYHSVSFALVNLSEEEVTVSFTPGQYGLNSTDRYTVMDIFSQFFIKNITLSETLEVDVPAEDAIIYTTFPL
ncbi:alpha-N-acetylgalactosaminidase-like isoform X1 [Maniola jurtina]|uniref:alpha-N-acetylgalactosaminidase-like isoform X1 n=1 Tax=Maniola jurtina TaxID=191418 RepID=UPI001E68A400|nr:alpha-N-acetylgalactosaminidase-like isoform X1 [Maniola jurtina]